MKLLTSRPRSFPSSPQDGTSVMVALPSGAIMPRKLSPARSLGSAW